MLNNRELNNIQLTQIKSSLKKTKSQQKALKALGLGKINSFVIKQESQVIYGLINKLKNIISVKYIN